MFQVQHNFYGQHVGKSDAYHLMQFHKGFYGVIVFYPVALTFSKLSLLALYWRIFRVTTARRPLQIVAALNIGWMLAAVIQMIINRRIPWIDSSVVCRRHFQLRTYSGLLGRDDQKSMHQLSFALHLERGFHDRFGLDGAAHASILHRPASTISVAKDLD